MCIKKKKAQALFFILTLNEKQICTHIVLMCESICMRSVSMLESVCMYACKRVDMLSCIPIYVCVHMPVLACADTVMRLLIGGGYMRPPGMVSTGLVN